MVRAQASMNARVERWKSVRRPASVVLRKGWSWGQRCLISPRGTVFEVKRWPFGLLARKRSEFQLTN